MLKVSLDGARKRQRAGLTSHILLQRGDTPTNNLAITWVVIEPGHKQEPHSHAPEQVYIVISGHGQMQVGEDFTSVKTGDLIYIPSNATHGIENIGSEKLVYLSASVPAFDLEALYDQGQLKGK